jgi:hypothetical protein
MKRGGSRVHYIRFNRSTTGTYVSAAKVLLAREYSHIDTDSMEAAALVSMSQGKQPYLQCMDFASQQSVYLAMYFLAENVLARERYTLCFCREGNQVDIVEQCRPKRAIEKCGL